LKFTQSKTQRHLSLPLVNDVANAIIDYLQTGRPESEQRQVFLKTRAPHGPLKSAGTFYCIIKSAMKKANIKLATGIPRGIHALRHTLATNMLKQGQSMESIASVLGHSSIESTRIYTHIDVDALRSVALEICDA
jgi:integrase/recombinase XerD